MAIPIAEARSSVLGYLPKSLSAEDLAASIDQRVQDAMVMLFPDKDWYLLTARRRMAVCLQAAILLIPAAKDWFARQMVKGKAEGAEGEFTASLVGLKEAEASLQVQLDRVLRLEGIELDPKNRVPAQPDAGFLLLKD